MAAAAQDDIAAAAAAVLSAPSGHIGETYELSGPESLTLEDVAATLTKFAGRTVTYHPETVEEAYRSRASYGAPSWQVEAWVSTYTAIAAGEMESVTDAIPRLTGHRATSLAELLRAG